MPRYFPLIDVLRGFAAIVVLWYHVIELGKWEQFPLEGAALLPRIGWIGVDLFFVISGFVIGRAAIEGVAGGPGWQRRYIDRRLRRIVPLYLATLATFLFLVDPTILRLGVQAVRHVLTHLLFVHNLSVSTHGSINGPNWSVALEMQFYLLMLLAAPWIARSSWWKLLLIWVAVAIGWRWGTTLVLPPGSAQPMRQMIAATQLPGTLDGFVFGICLAKLSLQGRLGYTPVRLAAWMAAAVGLMWLTLWLFWQRPYYWNSPGMVIFCAPRCTQASPPCWLPWWSFPGTAASCCGRYATWGRSATASTYGISLYSSPGSRSRHYGVGHCWGLCWPAPSCWPRCPGTDSNNAGSHHAQTALSGRGRPR